MTGSFPDVLRAAIRASGLPLARIQHRLRLRDVHVSVPTLSNWQRGRRTPQGTGSRRAVAELEAVLGLASGTLVALLDSRRPRDRSPSTVDALARLSQHDTVVVDATGRVATVRTRQVLSAVSDGADRWTDVWHHGTAAEAAALTGRWRCRPGTTRIDRRARLATASLRLDVALPAGAVAVTEYALDFGDTGPVGRFFRHFPAPVRDYVLEMRFAPAATVRCRRGKSVLTPSPSGVVTVAEPDVTGLVDVTWDYGPV